MKVILLEKSNLGQIGNVVEVKPGFARNYLIPKKKAAAATPANLAAFEEKRAELERLAHEHFLAAQARAEQLADQSITIVAKAREGARHFGSIGTASIASVIAEDKSVKVERSEIKLPQGNIRQTGEYEVVLQLHNDVNVTIKVNVLAETN